MSIYRAGGVTLRLLSCPQGVTGSTDTEHIDASSIFVDTAFRATPWDQERIEEHSKRTQAQILFVSESNVCRSVLAEAVMNRLILERGMQAEVRCESKGTRQASASTAVAAAISSSVSCGHAVNGRKRSIRVAQ